MSPATSSITSTRRRSRPRRSWRAAPTPRPRPSSASPRRSASRAIPSFSSPRSRSTETALPEQNGNGGGQLFDFDHSEFEAALAADHANVEDTARTLTREQVEACVSALANAKRVVIVGVDQMAFFASYLRHLLALLDLRAEVVATPRQESINRLARVDDETLVVAFSAGRTHPLIIRALKLARHRRSPTLAISDATLSEVGEHADYQLYYSSNGPSYTRSNTALMSVVQALAYGVYSRDKSAYKDRIRAFKLK